MSELLKLLESPGGAALLASIVFLLGRRLLFVFVAETPSTKKQEFARLILMLITALIIGVIVIAAIIKHLERMI